MLHSGLRFLAISAGARCGGPSRPLQLTRPGLEHQVWACHSCGAARIEDHSNQSSRGDYRAVRMTKASVLSSYPTVSSTNSSPAVWPSSATAMKVASSWSYVTDPCTNIAAISCPSAPKTTSFKPPASLTNARSRTCRDHRWDSFLLVLWLQRSIPETRTQWWSVQRLSSTRQPCPPQRPDLRRLSVMSPCHLSDTKFRDPHMSSVLRIRCLVVLQDHGLNVLEHRFRYPFGVIGSPVGVTVRRAYLCVVRHCAAAGFDDDILLRSQRLLAGIHRVLTCRGRHFHGDQVSLPLKSAQRVLPCAFSKPSSTPTSLLLHVSHWDWDDDRNR